MNLTSSIRGVGAVLFALGGLAYFGMNAFVFSKAHNIMSGQQMRDPLAKSDLTITDHRTLNGKAYKRGYLEMARFDEIDMRRFVHFTTYARVKDLLNPGEDAPSRQMEGVFAQSRAILYAKEECERVLKTLARVCEAAHADARLEDGLVRISATLNFIQKSDFGAPDIVAAAAGDAAPDGVWVFTHAHSDIQDKPRSTSLSAAARHRETLYKKAARDCAAIKRREGNCALTSLTVSTTKSRRDSGMKLAGRAEYAFLIRQPGS